MKLFTRSALAAGVLFLASSAAAQIATPPPEPSPAALESARHLMRTMHTDRTVDQLTDTLFASASQEMPLGQRAGNQALRDSVLEVMHDFRPRLIEDSAKIYASGFTEQEIAEMDRFYSSPTGQSVLAKLPGMTRQIVPIVMAEMPDLMRQVFDHLCEKTTCTAEDRTIYGNIVQGMKAGIARHAS